EQSALVRKIDFGGLLSTYGVVIALLALIAFGWLR
ncbi:MAG: hypothetical protein JWR75_993, partial [Devosia sp.]|nr:hypothetical protein [Devosia sp.]